MKIFVVLLFPFLAGCLLNSCGLIAEGNHSSNDCDSSYYQYDTTLMQQTFFCVKNGLKNYVVLNNDNDTILHYNEISKYLIEKVNLKDDGVKEIVNILRFGIEESINLKLEIVDGQIDSLKSSFFFFRKRKDSLYFKFSGYDITGAKIDSIWISKPINYFPSINEVFNIDYEYKTDDLSEWVYIPEKVVNDDKLVVVGFSKYTNEEGLSGTLFGAFYLDSEIIKWSGEVLSSIDSQDVLKK